MNVTRERKLKRLLDNWPSGKVATSSWLREMGISGSLTQEYLQNGWIESMGTGAYKKAKDRINWYGGLASLQQQLSRNIHLGGPTALYLRGTAHFIRFEIHQVFLFHTHNVKLPKWFLDYNWGIKIITVATSVFQNEVGGKALQYQGFEIVASSPERAILECLYLAPKKFDLLESYQLLESLRTLRPDMMQTLLEKCRSIRVKRLFLYMANKAGLPILNHMDLSKVDLGTGDRMIVNGGVYDSEYKISIPRQLAEYV